MRRFALAPALCLIGLAGLASPAAAAQWSLTPGYENFSGPGGPTKLGLTLEVQAEPFYTNGRWRIGLGAAAAWDEAGDLWAGGGLVVRYDMRRWFVEFSEMPGLYHNGSDETDLGGPVEFRSLLGLGYHLTPVSDLMLEVHHRSSADLYRYNPGVNGIGLRFTRRF